MPFRPPSRKERRDAIGLHAATAELRRWLDPDPFSPIATPGEDDWLADRPGAGQTFRAYTASSPNRPLGVRCRVYLLPVDAESVDLPALTEVVAVL